MNILIYNTDDIVMGGGTTLFFRIAKWFQCNGDKAILLVSKGSTIESSVKQLIDENSVCVIEFTYSFLGLQFDDIFGNYVDKNDVIYNMQYNISMLIWTSKALRKMHYNNVKNIFYAVYWGDIIRRTKLKQLVYINVIKKIVKDRSLIAMDKVMQELISRTCNVRIQDIKIIRLPMDCKAAVDNFDKKMINS